MSKKEKMIEVEEYSDGAVDMTGVHVAEKHEALDPNEKEEREAAKKKAKAAPKGQYVCLTTIKSDGKVFKRGDLYEGKLYQDILESKLVTTKELWDQR